MEYEIISLGYNCQPRTYLTNNELIKIKKNGRKSMVFDLTLHPTKGIIEILKNDFNDYLANLEYGFYEPFGLNYWQIKKYGIVFNHDSDCKENDIEKIKSRYSSRIENFKKTLESDNFLFLIHSIDETASSEDINILYEVIKNIRGEKPFKLIVWDMFENIKPEEMEENIAIYKLPHPFEDISDWFKPEKQNSTTKLWQKTLIDYTKNNIKISGFKIETHKRPLIDKIKDKIKPILKNIFTITNDVELKAKVLILFGIKFKIKKLKEK